MANEASRAKALAACRLILSSVADKSDRVSVSILEETFDRADIAKLIFELFDSTDEGSILASRLADTVAENLKDKNNDDYRSFLALFDSCVHLASSRGGSLGQTEMRKLLGSKGLAATITAALNSEKGGTGTTAATVDEIVGFFSNLTKDGLRNELTLADIEKFSATFRRHAKGKSSGLQREDFGKMVSSKNKFFVDRAFKIFDKNGTGSVSLDEYQETLGGLVGDNKEGALRFLFRVYDDDDDGFFTLAQLGLTLQASMEENGMKFASQDLDDLTWALWDDAGMRDSESKMGFKEWKSMLEKNPDFIKGLAASITRWCLPPDSSSKKKPANSRFNLQNYLQANRQLFVFLAFFLATSLALFIYKCFYFFDFRNMDGSGPNIYVMLARANGICLNYNSAFVLIFILRHSLTLLRKIGLVTLLPLDHHVFLHKLCGVSLFCHAWIHGVSHFINFAVNVAPDPMRFVINNEKYLGPVEKSSFNPPKGGPDARYAYWEWMLTPTPGLFGLIGGEANLTGIVLICILTLMFICSMPFVRRSGHFEVFYFTHLCYWLYFFLLIFHAPTCWHWLLVPLTVFGLELTYRLISMCWGLKGKTNVIAGIVLPSKVTGLVIKKPVNFRHVPGDWVFVKIPEIAKFEWHPFTISSAPEDEDTFTLHIRSAGGWTNKLYDYFQEELKLHQEGRTRHRSSLDRFQRGVQQSIRRLTQREKRYNPVNTSPEGKDSTEASVKNRIQTLESQFLNLRRMPTIVRYSTAPIQRIQRSTETDVERAERKRIKTQKRTALMKPLTIYIDGPFGAPASNIFRAKHAVLIATGIGVTPFSSILQSIMLRFWSNKKECPNCQHKWTDNVNELFNLAKVDFFWINRDQRSFEWFLNLLSQLEIEQAEKGSAMERFLDMHMYMTSALQKNDMRALGLQLALDLLHKKDKRDLITGLKSRTKAGRPNWDKVFTDLKAQQKGPITVFYCGNPHLAKTLQTKCEEFGFTYRKEVF